MIVPNSIYMDKEKLPTFVQTIDQETKIKEQYRKCDNINTIDVTQTIKKYKNLELYYKTDHHMTSLGAYILYTSFCKETGEKAKSITDFNKKIVSTDFLGTFDSKAQIIGQEADTITIFENEANTNLEYVQYDNETTKSIYNENYLYTKDKYSYFLNGNNSKVIVKTKAKNNKRLMIIKDSYAHNTIQFLCSNYEEIHVIDPRYYHMNLSDYVTENNITEVLVLYNFSNLMTDIGARGIK